MPGHDESTHGCRIATVGTSPITEWFIESVHATEGADLAGVCSRDPARAAAFAQRTGAPRSWAGLDQVLASSDVDAVYLATPPAAHIDQAIAAVRAGKDVLVEKPAAIDPAAWTALLTEADDHGVLVMEAMRNVHDPGTAVVADVLPRLGRVRRVSLHVAKRSARYDEVLAGRRTNAFDPTVGGGALFDLGIYAVAVMVHLFGPPAWVVAGDVTVASGVDGAGAAILGYPEMLADVSYSKITHIGGPSQIQGEDATLTIDNLFAPDELELVRPPAAREHIAVRRSGPLLAPELQRFLSFRHDADGARRDQARTTSSLEVIAQIRAAARTRVDL